MQMQKFIVPHSCGPVLWKLRGCKKHKSIGYRPLGLSLQNRDVKLILHQGPHRKSANRIYACHIFQSRSGGQIGVFAGLILIPGPCV